MQNGQGFLLSGPGKWKYPEIIIKNLILVNNYSH